MPKQPKTALLVMRLADMRLMHPDADVTHVCAACRQPVCLYPSGQRLLRTYGERRVRILCQYCLPPEQRRGAKLAPGALDEPAQSVRRH